MKKNQKLLSLEARIAEASGNGLLILRSHLERQVNNYTTLITWPRLAMSFQRDLDRVNEAIEQRKVTSADRVGPRPKRKQ